MKIVLFHIVTVVSLLISVVALYNAYTCLPVSNKHIFCALCAISGYLIVVCLVDRKLSDKTKMVWESVTLHVVPIVMSILLFFIVPKLQPVPKGVITDYERTFCDLQKVQIKVAQANGIQPFNWRNEAKNTCDELTKKGVVAKLSSNSDYHVRVLTHSLPFLVPKAEELLVDIAKSFRKISGTNARFEVTSVLRTKEDVKKLQKHNVNATTNSCHCYGTTFDISYASFKVDMLNPKSNKELRKALAEAIYRLRKEGRCYVKMESAQKCYHITVRE